MIWALVTALGLAALAPAVRLIARADWGKEQTRFTYALSLAAAVGVAIIALAIDGQSTDEPMFAVKAVFGVAVCVTWAIYLCEGELRKVLWTRAKAPRAALLHSEPRATKDMQPSEYDAELIERAATLGLRIFQCIEPVLGGYRYGVFLTKGPEVPVREIAASRRHHLPGAVALPLGGSVRMEIRRWDHEVQAVAFENGDRVTGLLALNAQDAADLTDGKSIEMGPLALRRSGEKIHVSLQGKRFGVCTADEWIQALVHATELRDEGPTIESGEGVFAIPLVPPTVILPRIEAAKKASPMPRLAGEGTEA